MRCGRMRCGDIWRCGGPKKRKKDKIGNKVQVIAFSTDDPEVVNMRFFTSGELEDSYLQLSWSEELGMAVFTGVGLDSEIANEVGTILLGGMGEGLLAGKGMIPPENGGWGIIDAEAVTLVQNVFDSPTEENKSALRVFLAERMELIMGGDMNAFIITRDK